MTLSLYLSILDAYASCLHIRSLLAQANVGADQPGRWRPKGKGGPGRGAESAGQPHLLHQLPDRLLFVHGGVAPRGREDREGGGACRLSAVGIMATDKILCSLGKMLFSSRLLCW